jgi:uncharacterized membrane protein YkvA (DUF1232 family)
MTRTTRLLRAANLGRLLAHLIALWKLFRHPDAPASAKSVAVGVLLYVISPIDLIPDAILGLGQLDDLLVIPIGMAMARQLAPPAVWQACQLEADRLQARLPSVKTMGLILVAWLAALLALLFWLVSR